MSGMVRPKTCGRLGNFLFQAAAAMAYAWDHRMEFSLPDQARDPVWHPVYLQHLVNQRWDEHVPAVWVRERRHTFQQLPFEDRWRIGNIILDGYWQTEKYFLHRRDQILEAFGFPWKRLDGVVSVHVRRGDYLTIRKGNQPKHPEVSQTWIERAMERFIGLRFLFFSDDLTWCRQTFGDRSDCSFEIEEHPVLADPRPEVRDLVLGSWCEHHVCSASTFSWWQAWLNRSPEKRIIMPGQWFSPGWGGLDTSDIVPANWERLTL